MLPCGHVAGFKGIGKPVIISFDDERIILAEQAALLAADLLLFGIEMGCVQLIPEGSAHGDHGLSLERYESAAV